MTVTNNREMSEIVKCKCGKAQMTYELISEDLWSGMPKNTQISKRGYGKICRCNSCLKEYDHFDPCMVKIFN